MDFEGLAQRILARPCPHKLRLVAVDGGAGAGKTTFSASLAQALGAALIKVDDFISVDGLEWFWPRLEAQVLQPLFKGQGPRYQIRDWVGDVRGRSLLPDWVEQPFCDKVVLEGVGSSRQALQGRLHYAVWIDAPDPLRMQRGLERDADVEGNLEIWEGWMPLERDFFTRDGARARADLVVDGTAAWTEGREFSVLEERG